MRPKHFSQALAIGIGEEVLVDAGAIERVDADHWRVNLYGHEALVGIVEAANVLSMDDRPEGLEWHD